MTQRADDGAAAQAVDGAAEQAAWLFRQESGRAMATLTRLLGDIDLAEEALQDAFARAWEMWPRQGVPTNPLGWIVSTGRNRAIDRLRRERRFREKAPLLVGREHPELAGCPDVMDVGALRDDQLRLIFTCCHPALAPEAQVALTLRLVGGLTTEEVARAFLLREPAVAQRLVRAKRKIRNAGIPYQVPDEGELPDRLTEVLACVYLIFNEGYAATSDDALVRQALCAEAIRLARRLCELMADQPEALALLALMLLHDSRRAARVDAAGELVLLADQDRRRWDAGQIAEGLRVAAASISLANDLGPYACQAAIAAEHSRVASAAGSDGGTRWPRIVALYARLLDIEPSPVVALNHGVAVGMAYGPTEGLAVVDALSDLDSYHLFHSARADLLRRLGRPEEAEAAYRRALALATQPTEQSFLEGRLRELSV